MTQTTAPLSALSIDTKSNVRKSGRGSEPVYVASIEAKGIIEPLIVRKNGGDGFVVVNGGKRLASLQWMMANSRLAAGHSVDAQYPVPIVVRDETDVEARDTSLMTNAIRSDMHPVDRFEAFAELVAGGLSKEEIAARYAMKPREVDQVLALGALSPIVRQAWREEKLRAEDAQAFTLLPDHDAQTKLFNRLKKAGRLYAHTIRREIGGEDNMSSAYVRFVGEKAYADAGGSIVKDLFSEGMRGGDVVSDPALAKRLADKKLQEKVDALKAEGWSWVELSADIKNRWSFERINKKKAEFSAADKARSGCIVQISGAGTLEVEYGMLSPAEARKDKKAGAKKTSRASGLPDDTLSQALERRLSGTLTQAAADAMAKQPMVAIAVAIAALSTSYGSEAVKLRIDRPFGSYSDHRELEEDEGADLEVEFPDVFKAALALAPKDAQLRLAALLGKALNLQVDDAGGFEAPGEESEAVAICAALDGTALNVALRERFSAEDYFNGVNGKLRERAVTEAVNADAAAKLAKLKKADQVTFCVNNVPETGWLPPELRTVHYDGPGTEKAKAAKPAKAKAASRKKAA